MTDLLKLEVITPQVEQSLIRNIEQAMASIVEAPDILPGRSKVLRLGWHYDDSTQWVGDMPSWLSEPLWPLVAPLVPDNCTINFMKPGKGVAAHVDSLAFGPDIYILSLGSTATMQFRLPGQKPMNLFIPPRSLMHLAGPLRTDWTHEILANRFDTDGLGVRHTRERRYSVVMRKKA